MLLRLLPLLLFAACQLPTPAPESIAADEECSVGVACGRATADGRPLLWKNRDAKKPDNVVTAFGDGRFAYVALCNAGSKTAVWGGANAAGFCIMNSVSRDLSGDRKKGPGNGTFMQQALRQCATVADFEALLHETDQTGRRTRANFGVIDRAGGAAVFETGHTSFTRFDADQQKSGILVRTNFATTAKGDRGKERFARATALCSKLPAGRRLDHRYLLQQFCRDLQPPPSAQSGAADRQDVRETIHRQTTVAAMVFHGVKPDEEARWTTMWALLGQPLFTLAVPCWPAAGGVAAEVAGAPNSPLCDEALQLMARFYDPAPAPPPGQDADKGNEEAETAPAVRWLHTEDLMAWRQQLLAQEDRLLQATALQLDGWRAQKPAPTAAAMLKFHRQQATAALQALRQLAGEFAPAGVGR